MKTISVITATHLNNNLLEIIFNDGKVQTIDFKNFFIIHKHPQYNKYQKAENFRKFKIENGNIVWGKNWDMIFPLNDLYRGKIN